MLTVTSPATTEPVTVADVKQHLRITHSSDDALLARLISSAREVVEMQTGVTLAAADYEWTPEAIEAKYPLWPVVVTSDDGVLPVTFSSVPGHAPQALKDAIMLRVQADYEDDAETGEKRRESAYRMAFPWRRALGV